MKRFHSTFCVPAFALTLAAVSMASANAPTPVPVPVPVAATRPACPKQSVAPMLSQVQVIRAIVCASAAHRLVIVGEVNGSNETPALVAALVKGVAATSRPVRLGLEMPSAEQAPLEAYLRSSGGAADRTQLLRSPFWSTRDGRSSRAMLRLIDSVRVLRHSGADVGVFVMEPGYGDQMAVARAGGLIVVKEAGMAQAIRRALESAESQQLVIALMGSFHARYGKDSPAGSAPSPSVTERLADAAPYVVLPLARETDAWNCRSDGCKVHSSSSTRGPKGRLPRFADEINVPTGTRVVELWLQKMTAALPALPAASATSVPQKRP